MTQDALIVAQADGDPKWDMDSAFQGKGIAGFADRAESSKNEKKVNPDQSKYCQALPLKIVHGFCCFLELLLEIVLLFFLLIGEMDFLIDTILLWKFGYSMGFPWFCPDRRKIPWNASSSPWWASRVRWEVWSVNFALSIRMQQLKSTWNKIQ